MARNPKKALSALLPEPIRVAGVTLRPFTIGSLLLLQRLGHPLTSGEQKPQMSNEQVMELLFVLSRPAEEVQALMDEGDDAFARGLMTFADTLPVASLSEIGRAVVTQFNRAWETGLATVPAGQKKTS